MIADEEEKRGITREAAGLGYRMGIATRFSLLDEGEIPGMRTGRGDVGIPVAGGNDEGDLVDIGPGNFIENDDERGFRLAIAIDEALEGEMALLAARRGDNSFGDFHG